MTKYPRLLAHIMVSVGTTTWGAGKVIKWHQKGKTFVAPIAGSLCPAELINRAIRERHDHKGTEALRSARILITLQLYDERTRRATWAI